MAPANIALRALPANEMSSAGRDIISRRCERYPIHSALINISRINHGLLYPVALITHFLLKLLEGAILRYSSTSDQNY
jgi:hypothetical protein